MATVKLVHPCLFNIPLNILDLLLLDVDGIDKFCENIEKLCSETDYKKKDFKGQIFELFVEYLCKVMGSVIGINEYQPSTEAKCDDRGVDGFGIGDKGKRATLQAKYRQGDYTLTNKKDDLSNLLVQSWECYDVDSDDKNSMFIISTARKIAEYTLEKMLCGKVKFIGRDELGKYVDGKTFFWAGFLASIKESKFIEVKKEPPIVLREHQLDAVYASNRNVIGQFIGPVGTGKTYTEAEIIFLECCKYLIAGNIKPIKIYSPRILLCLQLMKDIQDYLLRQGIDCDYINFNSGKPDERKFNEKAMRYEFGEKPILSTTNKKELIEACNKSIIRGRVPLVFSTYHSASKSHSDELSIGMSIFDEAHNTVHEDFKYIVDQQSDKKFFFTATPETNEIYGMNVEERYGKVLYQRSPLQMIEAGEICKPFLHIVKTDIKRVGELDNNPDAMMDAIDSAWNAHLAKIRENSFAPEEIGGKVIVASENQSILKSMLISERMLKFRNDNPDVKIYALSSDIGIWDNGEETNDASCIGKERLLGKIRDLKSHEKCIIFHVAMIGEGIDIPGITGVMPFRNMDDTRFIQFVGRCMRLHKKDREKFYAGEINPSNLFDYIKRMCYVIIPDFLESSADFEKRYKRIIRIMKKDLGFIPSKEISYTDKNGSVIDGKKVIKEMADDYEEESKVISHMLNWTHEIEEEEGAVIRNNEIIEIISNSSGDHTKAFEEFRRYKELKYKNG